ncbi:Holliday junction branch migration protein RuvA [Phaeobacter gallaeciensis]|uniref:Holliday junction branch migration protein RuvA n=1 Tax=Phaeobacter gallaeciensis TaxID=60890 RepID=UPI000BBC4C9A|nr:Holliday junction branch migration protein RuvA [Phaeobacter gallaeciensis]ATF19375.1 holliday junction ATP-dependent DNA helicase RuvA [Phaeobacter gallaeciensis]ATF23484.1 holliday junction ATP-dependent DNA helicase RuvA [Phaeobacter gallaeciensis]
MIGKLTGRLEYRSTDHVLIDVRGVGYIVYCSERTMAALPGVGEAVALYTDMVVREDLMQLYGFPSLVEKEWHRLLTSVQGVGAKVSLAILGALGPDGVSRAIALGDWAAVKAAKGVGPKTAQRIVLDLKDKAPGVMAMGGTIADAMDGPGLDVVEPAAPVETGKKPRKAPPKQPSGAAAASAGALSALGNLGYGPSDAAAAVAEAAATYPDADEAELIRAALRLLAPKG